MKKNRSNKINNAELYKRFSKNEISPVYIFSGNQTFLMDKAISELKRITLGASADFNFSLFHGDSASIRDIVETAKTYPMLSRMRLIVVKNAGKLPESELKSLDSYILSPSPSTCLILIVEEEKDISLEPKKNILYVDFALDTKDIPRQITVEAQKLGCEITKEAVETLITLIGENLQDIHMELEKLALFVGDKNKISAEDVENLTEKEQFKDVFQLVNAIAEKNKRKAMNALLDLEMTKEEPLVILNKISWRFRSIWKAKELIDKKMTEDEILKQLRTSPGAFYYLRQQANNFSYKDIKRITQTLYEYDRALKTSYIQKHITLTKLVLELCS
jgi:DNA polymerase-3 subunit delta